VIGKRWGELWVKVFILERESVATSTDFMWGGVGGTEISGVVTSGGFLHGHHHPRAVLRA